MYRAYIKVEDSNSQPHIMGTRHRENTMNSLRIWFSCTLLLLTVAVFESQAGNCPEDNKYDDYIYFRTMLLKAEGPAVKFNATREDFRVEYGRCNADSHASDMINYYESYGFNLRNVRADPFRYYLEEDFELNTISTVGNYRVLMASFYDFSKFENQHVFSAWWTLRARRDMNGARGRSLREDYWLYFGAWRITMHGREFCIYFKSNAPTTRTPEGLEPVDFDLESAEFGPGAGRGLLKIYPDFTLDAAEFVTFPADNPRYRRN